MDRISEFISYREGVFSSVATRRGIANVPPERILAVMRVTGREVFDKVRRHFGRPIGINSFYRSPVLNNAIGGSRSSQHVLGEAIDIDNDNRAAGPSNREIFDYIRANLEFDQLIWEFGDEDSPAWVHVSYRAGRNRGEVKRAVANGNGVDYIDI